MKLGLALSGGGIRATVFHAGVILRLASSDRLEDVQFLSSVSGGSLCVGLIYSMNGYTWPTSHDFKSRIINDLRNLLTVKDLERTFKRRSLRRPWTLAGSRAIVLAKVLEDIWAIKHNLSAIPDQPRWIINATSHETAKNWRFMSRRMGDYSFGYSAYPDIALSHALAASAALPVLVGPLILDATKHEWFEYVNGSKDQTHSIKPKAKQVHLWDGGLYDNLGIEAVIKRGKLQEDLDFLIISDANAKMQIHKTKNIFEIKRTVFDIPSSQVAALRARMVLDAINKNEFTGSYVKLGNTFEYIARQVGLPLDLVTSTLSDKEITHISNIPTTARRLTVSEFDLLVRHGYEITDYTLHAYHNEKFKLKGYKY